MTTPSNVEALPDGTRIGRTALSVSDLAELTAFYQEVVGLSVLRQSGEKTVLGATDTPLLILEKNETDAVRDRSAAGLYHNAFRVPSRAALGDALARIRTHWQLSGASDHGVSEALYLTDPEGNGIEIYRDFPRSEWPHSPEGSLRMGTNPLELEPLEAAAVGKSTVPGGTDLGHVHLEVSSLQNFRDFFVGITGFEVQTSMPAALFVSAGGYHHHIGANTWHHRSEPTGGSGLSCFEVVLPTGEALEVIRDRITSSRFDVSDLDDRIVVIGPDQFEVRFRVGQ